MSAFLRCWSPGRSTEPPRRRSARLPSRKSPATRRPSSPFLTRPTAASEEDQEPSSAGRPTRVSDTSVLAGGERKLRPLRAASARTARERLAWQEQSRLLRSALTDLSTPEPFDARPAKIKAATLRRSAGIRRRTAATERQSALDLTPGAPPTIDRRRSSWSTPRGDVHALSVWMLNRRPPDGRAARLRMRVRLHLPRHPGSLRRAVAREPR